MKIIKDFNSFINESINEKSSWSDLNSSEIAKQFSYHVKNDKSVTGDDLAAFMADMSEIKNINESPEKQLVEEVIEKLSKLGFKKIKIEDFITYWTDEWRLSWAK
jgi:DNA-binding ferritin-like protein (Dps family)